MKKCLGVLIILMSISSMAFAQDIATAIKQDDATKLHVSALPYPGCQYLYHEDTGTLTNHVLLTALVGQTLRIYGIEVHSLDAVNKGVIRFEETDGTTFYAGYLSTCPSAFGTSIRYEILTGLSLKVTTPGATAIVIHYTITGLGM